MNATEKPSALLQRWSQLMLDEPGLRARNAAARLGVSEGELVAARCGGGAIRLKPDFKGLLHSLEGLSEVLVITRNEYAVHEKRGFYRKLNLGDPYGTALDPNIDLRYNFRHWAHGFAVADESAHGPRESLQFFDRDGTSVHKIYRTDNTDDNAWQKVVGQFGDDDQTPGFTPAAAVLDYPVEPRERADTDALRKEWAALTDIHDFQPLLRKYKLRRIDALSLAGADLARPAPKDAWRSVLQKVAETGLSIMVFVGSPGVVQIHTGPVQKLLIRDGWFNVLDPTFNLHLREDAVSQCWVVYRPTDDGGVTSLELYHRSGELIGQLFGARKPGVPELKGWRRLLADVPAAQAEAAVDAV